MGRIPDHHPVRIFLALGIGLALAGMFLGHSGAQDSRLVFDPLAAVLREGPRRNLEAAVPAACYVQTDGISNPCWTCHTRSHSPNEANDIDLQASYDFSHLGRTLRWTNLTKNWTAEARAWDDEAITAYTREDNYTGLADSLRRLHRYPGYVPDLDFRLGFDEHGFAVDGSGWRALRYKPFPGTFWPTNGATDDVMIRLPDGFRRDSMGRASRSMYRTNLALLEAAICTAPPGLGVPPGREVEPIAEALLDFDLDGDGRVGGVTRCIRKLPPFYAGGAAEVPIEKHLYPLGTEFLHTVRYIDLDAPGYLSRRFREVRYSRKIARLSPEALRRTYAAEAREKARGERSEFAGSPVRGFRNRLGWNLQGFIEDAEGALRLQTREEHEFCMGCHSGLGVTVDGTFSFSRKVPGAGGWRHQDLRGIPDVPQAGHIAPEVLTYLQRAQAGDEFRANEEMLRRFFPQGSLQEEEVLRAAPGGDRDMTYLVLPSPQRAGLLNRAYRVRVVRQDFRSGRQPVVEAFQHLHKRVEFSTTGLKEKGLVFEDGNIWLDWSGVERP